MRVELDLPGVEVEYAAVREANAWTTGAPDAPLSEGVALVAARIGGVRLIDNHLLAEPWTEGASEGGR